MFASFHSNGTTPSFNDKLNTLPSGIGDGLQSSLYYHSTMRECGLGYLSMSPGYITSTLPHKDASHPVNSEPLVGREKIQNPWWAEKRFRTPGGQRKDFKKLPHTTRRRVTLHQHLGGHGCFKRRRRGRGERRGRCINTYTSSFHPEPPAPLQ